MSESMTNKPIHVIRRRGVKVSVFENRAGETTFHKLTIQKIYREDSGVWKTTTSLGRDDLPVAQLLIGQAWEFILDKEAASASPDSQETMSS